MQIERLVQIVFYIVNHGRVTARVTFEKRKEEKDGL